jgi:hypothetical protein
MYSGTPIGDLVKHYDILSPPGFPLEGYTALDGVVVESTFAGDVANLPATIFWRPFRQQIVVSICGTKLASQALQDVRVLKTKHPSGKGQVHTGFWSLYAGLRDHLKAGLREALDSRKPTEVVLTGHSMGGAVAYLLGIDLLAEDQEPAPGARPLLRSFETGSQGSGPALVIKIVSFGMPRVGDQALVDHFHSLVELYRGRYGHDRLAEFSVRTYNDGVGFYLLPS